MQNEPKDQEGMKEIWELAPNRSCRLSLHALFFRKRKTHFRSRYSYFWHSFGFSSERLREILLWRCFFLHPTPSPSRSEFGTGTSKGGGILVYWCVLFPVCCLLSLGSVISTLRQAQGHYEILRLRLWMTMLSWFLCTVSCLLFQLKTPFDRLSTGASALEGKYSRFTKAPKG